MKPKFRQPSSKKRTGTHQLTRVYRRVSSRTNNRGISTCRQRNSVAEQICRPSTHSQEKRYWYCCRTYSSSIPGICHDMSILSSSTCTLLWIQQYTCSLRFTVFNINNSTKERTGLD